MIILTQKYDMIISADAISLVYTERGFKGEYNVIIKDKAGNSTIGATFKTENGAKDSIAKMSGAIFNDARVFRFPKYEGASQEETGKKE